MRIWAFVANSLRTMSSNLGMFTFKESAMVTVNKTQSNSHCVNQHKGSCQITLKHTAEPRWVVL